MNKALVLLLVTISLILFSACETSVETGKITDALDTIEVKTDPNTFVSQTIEGGMVAVEVEPREYNSDAWVFEIDLVTHSVDLSEDLITVSMLTDAQGNEYKASGWKGDPPGGHHRSGQLIFSGIAESTEFSLNIKEVGGIAERIFTWDISQ